MKKNCDPEDHDFRLVKATWQVPNLMTVSGVLEHSKEKLICERCGEVRDAFPEFSCRKQR